MARLPWPRTSVFVAAIAVLATGCVGLDAGVEYPDVSDIDLDDYLLTPEGDPNPSVAFGKVKISPKVCEGIDTRMVTGPLDQEELGRFLATRGVEKKPKRARDDLWWYEFLAEENDPGEGSVRLRLAILKDRNGAAKDLHDSLLQHGPGWWGLRRGNLAILAPKTSLSEALQFAIKYRLVCWGTFTYTGVDDVYVISGGYSEF
ncbi:MAG: hypothetical protein JNL21_33385 [Myxococcales bacterium]|jgi:hypothetical protein|nr:hypothetical protein [Myxococcales bacterium]